MSLSHLVHRIHCPPHTCPLTGQQAQEWSASVRGGCTDYAGYMELRDSHHTYVLDFTGIPARAEAARCCTPDSQDLYSVLTRAARGLAWGRVLGSTQVVQVPAASSVGERDSWAHTLGQTLSMVDVWFERSGHCLGAGARGLSIYRERGAESRLELDRSDACFAVLGERAPDGCPVRRPAHTCTRCGAQMPLALQRVQYPCGVCVREVDTERRSAAAAAATDAGASRSVARQRGAWAAVMVRREIVDSSHGAPRDGI